MWTPATKIDEPGLYWVRGHNGATCNLVEMRIVRYAERSYCEHRPWFSGGERVNWDSPRDDQWWWSEPVKLPK